MIKKILGLLIIGLGILNFGFCVNITSDLPYSNFNLDSKVYIDTYINLDDGDGNPIILYKSTYNSSNIVNFFYRWQNGKLYGYKADNYSSYKGALKGIILCDNNFENCGPTYNPLNPENFYNGSLIGTVFNKILIKDQNEVVICFGNDIGSICTYTNGSFCNSSDSCGSKGFGGAGATIESLINKIGDNIQKYSPFNVEGGGGNGGGEEEITKPITTHPCMTLNELFELRPQYNTGLCYSSDKIRNGTSFETTTQQSIYELYPTYNEFRNDLNLYHNYCGNYVATQTACQNAFSGKQAEYSLISKLPNNINDKDLYNYCDLALNYDRNTSTCVINSGATKPKPGTEPTYEDIINTITNQNIQNQAPTTGKVFDELCEEGDENCLQNMAVNRNILESLQNIYDKITSLFEKRSGVEGLIPSYIMRLIFLTIFFTILLKK